MPRKGLEGWVDSLQSLGRYTFLRSEALAENGPSAEAVNKALQRLERRGRLAKIKKYFYVIIPLEYSKSGGLPPSWYIDDLMKALKQPYYVGLLSAAALHGASHQQPQEFQVFSDRFIRSLHRGCDTQLGTAARVAGRLRHRTHSVPLRRCNRSRLRGLFSPSYV